MVSEAGSALGSLLEREVLPLVAKPHRYVGHELGAVRKDWDATRVRMLFSYPDLYEVGMSHPGTQILYHVVNREPTWLMERAYAPWPDMEALMRERGIPLFSLESKRPARDFDVIGFTLQSELTYTNVLTMLDLAGVPLRQTARQEADPLILAGGPCASNPEPMAAFVDAFVLGDAEEALPEILRIVGEEKSGGIGASGLGTGGDGFEPRDGGRRTAVPPTPNPQSRHHLLWRLATEVPGVYVPSLYTVPEEGGTATATDPRLPFPVVARTVPALKADDHPRHMLVPLAQTTHERLPIEVQRGCVRGCRFCQAGYLYRPVRERGTAECVAIAEEGMAHGGHEEISLLSLSTADHSQAESLVADVSRVAAARGVAVALPSLRADAFSLSLAEGASRVRRTGFTFAPEAGSERLRRVINKGLTEPDILLAVERVLNAGWSSVKLYLMIGHPTESDADFEELAGLVTKLRAIVKQRPGRSVCLSVSPFVPKPHTPFQWERQDSLEETRRKLRWIKKRLAGAGIEVKHHDLEATAVEGLLSRGGRETADVIERAWRRGARFDEWTEQLRPGAWMAALADAGSSLEACFSARDESAPLPWEIASYGIARRWFRRERRKAYAATLTDECRHGRCSACGVCDFETVKNVLAVDDGTGESGLGGGEVQEARVSGLPNPEPRTPKPHHTIRIRYAKLAPVRFLSHLDVLRELLRTFRRADVPLVYSEGFVPRPRVSAGLALPTGWTSSSEWLDLELAGEWGRDARRLAELLEELNRHAADGLRFLAAGLLLSGASLSASIARSAYRATFPQPPFEPAFARLDAGCRAFLARDAVPVIRERAAGRTTVDLRPLVYDLAALDGATVALEVRTASDGSAKPTEILEAACGVPRHLLPLINIHKTGTWLAGGMEPLASCEVAVGATTVETGDTDQWEPAGDPRGDPGGRHPGRTAGGSSGRAPHGRRHLSRQGRSRPAGDPGGVR
jgi:radical SAM-linked protein